MKKYTNKEINILLEEKWMNSIEYMMNKCKTEGVSTEPINKLIESLIEEENNKHKPLDVHWDTSMSKEVYNSMNPKENNYIKIIIFYTVLIVATWLYIYIMSHKARYN